MKWTVMTLAALALVALASAGASHTQPGKLDGTWAVVSAERDGQPTEELKTHRLTFHAREFVIRRDRETVYQGTFTTDRAKKPAQIDFLNTGGQAKGQTWRGIYLLEGDGLKIVDNAPDVSKPRPTSFTTTPGSGYVMLVFKRVEP
jgi:uncharacterized protein (TIGR03067 family)